MKRSVVSLLAGVSLSALLVCGCASNEAVVKKEAPVAPEAAAAKEVPVKVVEDVKPVVKETAKAAAEVKKVADDAAQQAAAAEKQTKAAAQETVEKAKAAPAPPAFETAYFDFDKSDLRQDARDVLSKNAEVILKSLPGAKVQIAGHCDERGSAEYNLALGERRAKSAQKYLTTMGVKAENLSVISYGKEKPAVQGSDEAAWAKNRRAEFAIVK